MQARTNNLPLRSVATLYTPFIVSTALIALVALIAALTAAPVAAATNDPAPAPAEKIQVAILTGQNNHAWFKDTPVLEHILDSAEIFDTTVVLTPDRQDPDKAEKWKAFEPNFADYDVIVLNYNGEMWPDRIKRSFETYISEGGAAFSFHAANNPFRGWTEYEQMIGQLWRNNKAGKRIYFNDKGEKQVMPAGEGPGAGHGRQHPFVLETIVDDHPVFQGLPKKWMHAKDELYHGQRGPAENMTVLMTAYSNPATGGTGVHEAVVWTIPYGKGTVMTNTLGHWWRGSGGGESLQCAGFHTLFQRSVEWLATGKVTINKPQDFPTVENASMRPLPDFEPLAYIYVKGVPGSDPLASCGCSIPTQPHLHPAFIQYAAQHENPIVPGQATADADER